MPIDRSVLRVPEPGSPPPPSPRPPRKPRRPLRPWLWAAGAVGTLVVVFVVAVAVALIFPSAPPLPADLPQGRTPDGRYRLGHADAPITVTEYADFQCPGCQSFALYGRGTFLTDELRAGKVKFVFADFPLFFHANAVPAAVAARCAGEGGRFWAYHDRLFETRETWAPLEDASEHFRDLARREGLDLAAFDACVDSTAARAFVRSSAERAEKLKLPGTPSFAVNGRPVPWSDDASVEGSLAAVREAVREALARLPR